MKLETRQKLTTTLVLGLSLFFGVAQVFAAPGDCTCTATGPQGTMTHEVNCPNGQSCGCIVTVNDSGQVIGIRATCFRAQANMERAMWVLNTTLNHWMVS